MQPTSRFGRGVITATCRSASHSFSKQLQPSITLLATYILLIRELVDRAALGEVSPHERRIMRIRSIITLCVFGAAAAVALIYPLVGLAMCCCCLIVYLRPEAPGARK